MPLERVTPRASDRDRWHVLAMMIKERYQTDMTVKEIAAELSYQEYLLSIEK